MRFMKTLTVSLLVAAMSGAVAAGPLHNALEKGDTGKVRQLLKKGASTQEVNAQGFTPLQMAVMYRNTEAAKLLIKQGAEVNGADVEGMTPLHVAAGNASTPLEMYKLLVSHGANVNAIDKYGRTPLHLMARTGKPEVAELLMDKGAKADARDGKGRSPKDIAKKARNERMVAALSGGHFQPAVATRSGIPGLPSY